VIYAAVILIYQSCWCPFAAAFYNPLHPETPEGSSRAETEESYFTNAPRVETKALGLSLPGSGGGVPW